MLSLALVGVLSAPASAQQYPPPTPTNPPPTQRPPKPTPKPKCNHVGTTTNGRFRAQKEFARGDTVTMKGGRGCVGPKERVDLNLDNRRIGATVSTKNGAYTVSGRIPPNAKLGNHRVVAVSRSGKRYKATIRVEAGSGGSRRTLNTTTLLGGWVVLAAILAAFVLSTRRRRPLASVAVDSDVDVPLIDTWDFPVNLSRPAPARKPRPKSGGAKRSGAAKKTKPKAAKPSSKIGKAKPKPKVTPKATSARKPAAQKATPTRRRAGSKAPTGSKAPKGAAAKAQPKRKPPKE